MSRQPEWYRDVVIYQLHVRSFHDSDGDGTGDFDGLTGKLDYLVELGIEAIWLQPFFPSPLRDDGYDIADYAAINPSYGDMESFRRFLAAAHERHLRVIIEMVMNHTSDAHPWFQRARTSPAGSPERDFYVWSDDPTRYAGTRIIFQDFEASNWSWDPVAQSYFWHRFYAHQPDLNFESPDVKREIFAALDRWFEMGVDGVRLDAVPYLFEREGTTCENLPETHAFLKELRAHVDEHFPDRLLLAEANQWPEDAVAYFGDGDECHMAFHFPVMPRLYLAVQMESRAPVVDILEQTPSLPPACQWAIFLRNHDELTLEMVTDEERDYMYRRFAGDPRMRVNLGIRRRLAPLLQDDRRRIELLNALLLSLPGTPVVYYGDEIGMGDNVHLGDRDSVRTPMQWSDDRNGGFSRADPQRLFLPVVSDPQHHYEAVNVDAQKRNPSSLWWWMRRMIALRQRHPVFARGEMQVVESDNTKVLTFLRTLDGQDDVLVVANLSRHAQRVQVPLPDHQGAEPVELAGGAALGCVEGDLALTLGPHDVFWIRLQRTAPEVLTADSTGQLPAIGLDRLRLPLDRGQTSMLLRALQPHMLRQRWFGDRHRRITEMSVIDAVELPTERPTWFLIVQAEFDVGEPSQYAIVLGSSASGESAPAGSALSGFEGIPGLYDAFRDPTLSVQLAALVMRDRSVRGTNGTLVGRGRIALEVDDLDEIESRAIGAEQSNSSRAIGDRWVLKLLRKVEAGIHPEVELLTHLEAVGFEHVARLVGTLEHRTPGPGEATTVATIVTLAHADHDAYTEVTDQAARFLEWAAAQPDEGAVAGPPPGPLGTEQVPDLLAPALAEALTFAELLGTRTAELHEALARGRGPRLQPQAFDAHAQRSMYQALRTELRTTLGALRAAPYQHLLGVHESQELEATLLGRAGQLLQRRIDGERIRIHADLHLGQIIVRAGEVTFIDFEGEPARPLGERAIRRSPLVDVAGMIRSFDYAGQDALAAAVDRGGPGTLQPWADAFGAWTAQRFTCAYLERARSSHLLPSDPDDLALVLEVAVVQKAAYEIRYEIRHRPERVQVPLAAILRVAGGPHPATASDAAVVVAPI